MDSESIAARIYPEGLPGVLSVKEFCHLMGISRPTGLSLIRQYPGYSVPRGNTQLVKVGLYQMLTCDSSVTTKIEGKNQNEQ